MITKHSQLTTHNLNEYEKNSVYIINHDKVG